MRIPLGWLGTRVPLENVDVADLAERLTFAGIEVDAVDTFGLACPEVVAGVVRGVEAADRPGLVWLTVDVGRADPVLVASRAPNLQAAVPGACLAVALPGAVLFAVDDSGLLGTLVVKVRELFGRSSGGVGCSRLELGLGTDPAVDHVGVLLLPDSTPGRPVREVLTEAAPGAETVFTLAILPNIARCQSVLGLAREVAALLRRAPDSTLELAELTCREDSPVAPTSSHIQLCDRFATALVEGVVVRASPGWIQQRLVTAGMNPINNVVDASNLVMLELGLPNHAYDADRLPSLRLHVRPSRPGEPFKALKADADAAPVALPGGLPLITSDDVAVGQAGVMGGYGCRVTQSTTRLLLEAAHFDFIAIRRSQQATLTFTEASARFSRGTDPALPVTTLRRLLWVLGQSCPELRVVEAGLWAPTALAERSIALDTARLRAALGVPLDDDAIRELLELAGLRVEDAADGAVVWVPTSRQDLERAEDLFEEVARLAGYDRLPATMPAEPVPTHLEDRVLELRDLAVDRLVRSGLQETLHYTLTSAAAEAGLFAGRAPPTVDFVEVVNPGSQERHLLRRSLLPQLLATAAHNLRHTPTVALFEAGVVMHPERSQGGLPAEPWRLGLVLAGQREQADLHRATADPFTVHDLAGVVTDLADALRVQVRFAPADEAPYHPGICAEVLVGDACVGRLGALHPEVHPRFELPEVPVFAAELDLDALLAAAPPRFEAPGPPRFPEVQLDVSVVVGRGVPAGALLHTTRASAGPLLRDVTVFDVYQGPPLPPDARNVGLRLRLGADRTLHMEEAEAVRDQVVRALEGAWGAELRGT